MARIFLCHASEDKAQVCEVYQQLKALGFAPWLDEVDILPGQDWDYEIERALETSDLVIVFLSTRSVEKVGYVQREFRRALYRAEEMPEGFIHTIPVKLDDCVVPRRFSRHQWMNLYENGALDRIIKALRLGMRQRQHFTPEPALKPPPEQVLDRDCTISESEGRCIVEAHTQLPQELEPPPISQPEKLLVTDQKSRRVSVSTIVSWVTVAVSIVVVVTLDPKVREWLGLGPPREITTRIGMTLVRIPAGEFQMGSNEGEAEDRPVHPVRISKPFYLGKYEVTQGQWEAVMGTNPSEFAGIPNRPVEKVSWKEVQEFTTRLNKQEGWEVCRLPTEAEWEYAARAGTTAERYEYDVNAIAWYGTNSREQTHEVGQKRPNAWRLYDMR